MSSNGRMDAVRGDSSRFHPKSKRRVPPVSKISLQFVRPPLPSLLCKFNLSHSRQSEFHKTDRALSRAPSVSLFHSSHIWLDYGEREGEWDRSDRGMENRREEEESSVGTDLGFLQTNLGNEVNGNWSTREGTGMKVGRDGPECNWISDLRPTT